MDWSARWTGALDWSAGLERGHWTGAVAGLERALDWSGRWTGALDWSAGLERALDWSAGLER